MANASVWGKDGSCRDVISFDENLVSPLQLFDIVNEIVVEGWGRAYVHQHSMQPYECFITSDKQYVNINAALKDAVVYANLSEILLKDYLAARGR